MDKRPDMSHLSSGEYLIELGRRLQSHAKDHVIGEQATREVEYAGLILRMMGEDWIERKNDVR